MSIDTCGNCRALIDTDMEPEAYLLTPDTVGLPAHKQRHVCLCRECREELSETELERRTP